MVLYLNGINGQVVLTLWWHHKFTVNSTVKRDNRCGTHLPAKMGAYIHRMPMIYGVLEGRILMSLGGEREAVFALAIRRRHGLKKPNCKNVWEG